MHVGDRAVTYDQPEWWASIDDPLDQDGQPVDEDNIVWAKARRDVAGQPED